MLLEVELLVPVSSNGPLGVAVLIHHITLHLESSGTSPSSGLEMQSTGIASIVVGDGHITVVIDNRGSIPLFYSLASLVIRQDAHYERLGM